jgi:SAM-dependent methyltransferase
MTNTTESWERVAAHEAAAAPQDLSTLHYGVELPTETELRLVGRLTGRRVLDLGCGPGHNVVAAALQGAYAIGVDAASAMVAHGRTLAEENGMRVEWRVGDIAELAWLRADSIDVALATGVLAHIEDFDRVMRQVHRVLRTGGIFAFTHPHPMSLCAARDIEVEGGLPLGRYEVRRSYFDPTPIVVERDAESFTVYPRTISDILSALTRAGYGLDAFIEPEPPDGVTTPLLPRSLIVKVRKQGS